MITNINTTPPLLLGRGNGLLFLAVLLLTQLVFAQRVTTTNAKGTKLTTGNTVTEAATAPTSPTPIQGDIWLDTTANLTKFWDGSAWKPIESSTAFSLWDTDIDTGIQVEEGADDDTIRFDTNGTERMVIDSGGNVGIGTDTPSFTLETAGANSDALINSVRVGRGAGDVVENTAVGFEALDSNTTTTNNTAIGYRTLANNTGSTPGESASNTAVGYSAMTANTSGNNNTALGANALVASTTAHHNVVIGGHAALNNTTGSQNTVVGGFAFDANTTGDLNTAVGYGALAQNISGIRNIGIGVNAGNLVVGTANNSAPENSIFIGKDTKAQADNQTNQIVIGHNAMGIGSNTVVLGNDDIVTTFLKGNIGAGTHIPTERLDVNGAARVRTLDAGDTTTDEVVVATSTGVLKKVTAAAVAQEPWFGVDDDAAATDNTEDMYAMGKIGIGTDTPTFTLETAGANSDARINGIRIGKGPGDLNNTVVGLEALNSNTTGHRNTTLGYLTLQNNTIGHDNIAIGSSALRANTEGNNNHAIGSSVLNANTTGENNIGVGIDALKNNQTGNFNIGIGAGALVNSTLHSSVAVGGYALATATTGQRNVGLGHGALQLNATGTDNVAVGYRAGRYITASADNTITNNSIYIGKDTKAQADNQTNQIVIGYNAQGIGSNTVVLGNDAIVTTALKGDVGIGTTGPTEKLDVDGTARIRTLNAGNTATDEIVVADANGVLKTVAASAVAQQPWYTAGTTTGHTSNTGNMFFSGNIGVATSTLSAGKVATFAGDVDIQGVLDPTKIILSGDGTVGSFNPTTNNQYEIEFQEGRDLLFRSNNNEVGRFKSVGQRFLFANPGDFATSGTSPSAVIGIDGTTHSRLRLTAGTQETYNDSEGASIDLHGNDATANSGVLDLVAGDAASAANPAIKFWTNTDGSTQQTSAVLTGAGNFGIGANITPSERLDVDGQVRIRKGNPKTNRVLTSVDNNGTAEWVNLKSSAYKTTLSTSRHLKVVGTPFYTGTSITLAPGRWAVDVTMLVRMANDSGNLTAVPNGVGIWFRSTFTESTTNSTKTNDFDGAFLYSAPLSGPMAYALVKGMCIIENKTNADKTYYYWYVNATVFGTLDPTYRVSDFGTDKWDENTIIITELQ